ncbi:MAG: ABC transporter permease [Clostridiaceae bacterium]|nr:ABC transporter permease [Clostridiaceae bacterium]HZW97910.1 methionine ABC transporter permease [Bacillota bacterium]
MGEYLQALYETLLMVGVSSIFSIAIGLPLGIVLVLTQPNGIKPIKTLYRVLDIIINLFRSLPFIILIIVFAPLALILTGRSSGTMALTVPLSLAAIPFVARIMETSINEVGQGVVEAALAMGTSIPQLITRVLIPEAMPALIQGVTTTIINIIGYSAMAGVIGGGGLGDLAIRWGYYNRQTEALLIAVILIVILVQAVQLVGNALSRAIDHR